MRKSPLRGHYCKRFYTQMKKVGPRRGLDVIYESFGPADTDMLPQLTRIRDSGAQAVICWTVTPAGVVFIKQAAQLGLDKRTLIHSYGFVSARYMTLAGDAAKSICSPASNFPSPTSCRIRIR